MHGVFVDTYSRLHLIIHIDTLLRPVYCIIDKSKTR